MGPRIIAFDQMGSRDARRGGDPAPRGAQAAPAPGGGVARTPGPAGAGPGPTRRRVHGAGDERSLCLVEETAVAGTRHVPGVRALADGLAPGDELLLVRDRRNPYDPWATEVRDGRGNRLGYVSCEHNEVVARLIDGGRDVAGLVGSVDQLGNWTRIQMEVRLYA